MMTIVARARLARSLVLSSLVLALPGCGNDGGPTGPVGGASPTPAPTPTPTPTPPPSSSPTQSQSCRALPATNGSTSGCRAGTANFATRVRAAVDSTIGATYRDPITGATYEIVQGD